MRRQGFATCCLALAVPLPVFHQMKRVLKMLIGKHKLAITDPTFLQSSLSVWIGPFDPEEHLKRRLELFNELTQGNMEDWILEAGTGKRWGTSSRGGGGQSSTAPPHSHLLLNFFISQTSSSHLTSLAFPLSCLARRGWVRPMSRDRSQTGMVRKGQASPFCFAEACQATKVRLQM